MGRKIRLLPGRSDPEWLLKYYPDDDAATGDDPQDRLILAILDAIADGCSLTQSCLAAGTSHTSWARWERKHPALKACREIAAARSYVDAVQSLRRAMREVRNDPKLWASVMTYLERRHPELYGKVDRLAITARQVGPIEHQHIISYQFGARDGDAAASLETAWPSSGAAEAAAPSDAARLTSGDRSPRKTVGEDGRGSRDRD